MAKSREELRTATLERMAAEGVLKTEVWQETGADVDGEVSFVGHMLVGPPMRSQSPMYSERPGDFTPGLLDGGKRIWIASWTLGPRDLEAIPNFRPVNPAPVRNRSDRDYLFALAPPRKGLWPREVLVPLRELSRP